MTITIFDYGAGNLHSLAKAIALVAAPPRIEADPRRALDTDVLVLPGVGAFPQAAARIAPAREAMARAIREGLPCLGICLGMQLLFRASEEGEGDGLGVFAGRVGRLRAARLPQIGWATIDDATDPAVLAAGLDYGYYANSFVCRPEDPAVVTAWSEYEGDRFPAIVRAFRTVGIQSHPEKSSAPGLGFLRAFFAEAAG